MSAGTNFRKNLGEFQKGNGTRFQYVFYAKVTTE